jgi:CPA2 family monovalent cation:H+ antiporter-2
MHVDPLIPTMVGVIAVVLILGILFVSIGMLVDTAFFIEYWRQALALVFVVFVINALVLKALGENWQTSLYSAALLAQTGEFSFVLASVGLSAGIIEGFGYPMTIAVIALSLLFSPGWIAASKWLLRTRS